MPSSAAFSSASAAQTDEPVKPVADSTGKLPVKPSTSSWRELFHNGFDDQLKLCQPKVTDSRVVFIPKCIHDQGIQVGGTVLLASFIILLLH